MGNGLRRHRTDGPVASGKGTVAQGVTASWDSTMLNSGALYRAVAGAAMKAAQT